MKYDQKILNFNLSLSYSKIFTKIMWVIFSFNLVIITSLLNAENS